MRGLRVRLACALALFFLEAQTSPFDLLAQPVPPPDHRLAYGKNPLQYGELRLPPGKGPFPVAIVVHGGCWLSHIGGLPPDATTLALVRPLAAGLTAAGFATWNIEYRRVGDPGGGWPGTFDDIGRAADSLRHVATQYHLDLKRTIAIGHSSGGHFAMWLGSRSKLAHDSAIYVRDPLPLAGVVDLDGPPTLPLPAGVLESICGQNAIEPLLGGTPAQVPLRYRDASAVLPPPVPAQLFTTMSFPRQWADVSTQYAARAGPTVAIHQLDDANHFDIINPQSTVWPQIRSAAERLLTERPHQRPRHEP